MAKGSALENAAIDKSKRALVNICYELDSLMLKAEKLVTKFDNN